MKKLLLHFFLATTLFVASGLYAFPSVDAARWGCLACRFPYPVFTNNPEGGFQFDFPQPDSVYPEYGYGVVGYITTWFLQPVAFVPAAISITFRIESSPDVEYVSVDVPSVAARFRLLFMSTYQPGCQIVGVSTNPPECEFHSWWSSTNPDNPGYYLLGSADGKTFTMRVPLEPQYWTSVLGRSGIQAGGNWFDMAKSNILQVGFTFGGNFAGHGDRLNAGSSTVKVLDYQLIPKEMEGMP